MKKLFILRPLISTKFSLAAILIPLLFAFLSAMPAAAWGPVGHETVAYIAADNLTPAAKKKVAAILAQGDDLASVSNWADQVRQFGRPETAPWHFIDLPIRKELRVKDEQDYCPNNDLHMPVAKRMVCNIVSDRLAIQGIKIKRCGVHVRVLDARLVTIRVIAIGCRVA